MDFYPQNLEKKEKIIHYLIEAFAVIFSVTMFCTDLRENIFFLSYNGMVYYFDFLPTMLISGILGYVPAMLYILLIFGGQVIFDLQLAARISVHLFLVIIMYTMARKWWFRSYKTITIGFIIVSLYVSIGNVVILALCGINAIPVYTAYNLFRFYVSSLSQVVFAFVIIYNVLINLEDRKKNLFSVGHFYTANYVENEEDQIFDIKSDLRRRVVLYIIVELILISLVAGVIGSLSFRVTDFDSDYTRAYILQYSKTGYLSTSVGIGHLEFTFRAISIISCMVIPVVSIFVYSIQTSVLFPIRHMTNYLKKFGMANSDEERVRVFKEYVKLQPKRKGDMLILYNNLNNVMQDVMDYIDKINKEQELKTELEIAKQANEAKNNFLSSISHEIRTPINAVLGMDELIIRETSERNIKQYAYNIKNAGNTLLSLISDVLDFSKIEAGKMEIINIEYDLSSTINDLVVMIDIRAKDKGLAFNVFVDPYLPKILYGDELRLKQCVLNLLTNAVKYTPEGSVTLRVGFDDIANDQIRLKIWVEDTGMGIAKEDMDKFFSPFERLDMKRNRTTEGTGLGMSIVTKLLEMMGANLKVYSKVGVGSRFLIEINQKIIRREVMGNFVESYIKAQDGSQEYSESFKADNVRILVVDDTEMNLIVIKGLLKNTGVKIDTALSGVEALGLINTIRYDVIFIDHRMPNMSGIELLHHMNESEDNKNVGVPVIALTANVVSGARDMYLKEGFTDYMSKPVDGARLEDMIVRLVPEEKINLLMPLENVSNSEKEKSRESAASSSNIIIGTSNYGGTAVKSQGAKLNAEERFNKDVEGIDFDMAVQNCGGEDVLEEVLENFLINIDSRHDMIEKYYKEGDIRNYTIQVHSIKSSARLIGAMDISRRAASLEQNGMDENVDEINKLTPKFLEDLLTYKDKINTVLRKDGASKVYKPEIEINMLKDAFRSLEELVAAFDFDGADSIMDMLDEYLVPAEYQEVYDKLIQLMAAVDIDGLTALLKEVNAEN